MSDDCAFSEWVLITQYAAMVLVEAESQSVIIAEFHELGEIATASIDQENVKLRSGGEMETSRMKLRAPVHTRKQLNRIGIP